MKNLLVLLAVEADEKRRLLLDNAKTSYANGEFEAKTTTKLYYLEHEEQ